MSGYNKQYKEAALKRIDDRRTDDTIAAVLQADSYALDSKSGTASPTTADFAIAKALQDEEDMLSAMELEKAAKDVVESSELDRQVLLALANANRTKFQPGINTIILASDDNEYFSRKLRLQKLLTTYGLREFIIKGDGNCQFASLGDQLYRDPSRHSHVRKSVISHLSQHARDYAQFVPYDFREYLKRMSKLSEWGDHVTLKAAADLWGCQINLITSYEGRGYIEIKPKNHFSRRILWLSFFAEVHYNSVYPAEAFVPGQGYTFEHEKRNQKNRNRCLQQ